MNPSVCRWGILGTAVIAKKNWRGIWLSGNGRVAAVASRNEASASKFIADCQRENAFDPIPVAVEGYERLLAREDIDAVYIPLPTATRKEWVIKAAEAGKHVLCEKPVATSASEVREMLAACEQHKVQFMDGVMFMHSARLPAMRQVLDDPQRFGAIRRITTNFSFLGDETFQRENIRVMRELEPFGCLGDLGWYNIRFTLWAMRWQMPSLVTARCITELKGIGSSGPVPGSFAAELLFPDGVSASFYCSFLTEISQTAAVYGQHGYVTLDDFVLPFVGCESAFTHSEHRFRIDGCRFNMERHDQRGGAQEYSSGEPDAQEVVMARRFSELCLSGNRDPLWGQYALKTQSVMDACMQSAQNGGAPVTTLA